MARVTKETLYLRHNFTSEERLAMGSDLASAHNTMLQIEEEENRIKATFKERQASVEQKIGTLSRELGSGFTMQNVETKLLFDNPNVGEVSYARTDNGEIVKTRPMTQQERQLEIEFEKPVVFNQMLNETAEIINEFFEKNKDLPAEEESEEESEEEAEDDEESEEAEELTIVEAPPEEARQAILTMGDAKKRGRPKKEPVIPTPAEETGVPIDDMPF